MKKLFKFYFRILVITLILGCNQQAFQLGDQNSKRGGSNSNGKRTYLRLHPENSRYFQDAGTGESVVITSYSFDNLVPTSRPTDYTNDLKRMKDIGTNYTRVWHLIPWEKNDAIWPWARSQTSGARMGGNKFDLGKWNEEYWTRMKDAIQKATDFGITSEIMLFDKSGISEDYDGPNRWGGNPWNPDNNINPIEIPKNRGSGIPDFYDYANKPILRGLQEAYVRRLIDETVAFNVMYEVENEHNDSDAAFGTYWGQFVKNYIAQKYPKHPRLVSYSSISRESESFYGNSAIDVINWHPPENGDNGRYPYFLSTYIEPHWASGKPVNIDEFIGTTNPASVRWPAWVILTSGGHFHIEEAKPEAKAGEITQNIQTFLKVSKWDFIHAVPNRHRSPSGFCMVQENIEYVCYYTKGGGKRLNSLPAGTYATQWWNPRQGGFSGRTISSHGGGNFLINTPDGDDWVLHIKNVASVARGAITPPPPSVCPALGWDTPIDMLCAKKTGKFTNDVRAAIDMTTQRYPELFDFNDTACSNCYLIKDGEYYHWYVSEMLDERGYCAGFDSEEIGVKNSNNFSEQYDICLASMHIRYGFYASTCTPTQVPTGPLKP